MKRRGFTLIELLVVIAIIAILAAILFPVFAQAKLAAKKTTSLSGVKNVALGHLIYAGDNDDYPPVSSLYGLTTAGDVLPGWSVRIQPYLKSLGILRSPVDTGLSAQAAGAQYGPWQSFAANCQVDRGLATSPTSDGYVLIGYISPYAFQGPAWNGSYRGTAAQREQSPIPTSAVTKPAETIAFAEKDNADVMKNGSVFGNSASGFTGGDMILTDDTTKLGIKSGSWSDAGFVPRGTRTAPPVPFDGTTLKAGWYSDAALDPFFKSGTVSAHYSGQSVFTYVDGHAKALKPEATNPDPINNYQADQWIATR